MSLHLVPVSVLVVVGVIAAHPVASLHEVEPEVEAVVLPRIAGGASTSRSNFFSGCDTVLIHAKAFVVAPHLVLVLAHLRLRDVGILIHNGPIDLFQVRVAGFVFGNVSLTRTI